MHLDESPFLDVILCGQHNFEKVVANGFEALVVLVEFDTELTHPTQDGWGVTAQFGRKVRLGDWPYVHDARDFWMRATVARGVLRLQVSADGETWPLVRLAPFPIASSYRVGPMACTPERSGLSIRFSDLRIAAPLGKELHDLI